jgi:outer membrane lipoprotein SlyB
VNGSVDVVASGVLVDTTPGLRRTVVLGTLVDVSSSSPSDATCAWGAGVGCAVGDVVGFAVGDVVGRAVGDIVGAAVGGIVVVIAAICTVVVEMVSGASVS